jgi:hypothetical protein
MVSGRTRILCNVVLLWGAGAALAACTHAEAMLKQSQNPAEATVQTAAAPAAEAPPSLPMTREQASTDCWMKYDKDRHLSLDQRLPLVEKCTAEKLKAAAR